MEGYKGKSADSGKAEVTVLDVDKLPCLIQEDMDMGDVYKERINRKFQILWKIR